MQRVCEFLWVRGSPDMWPNLEKCLISKVRGDQQCTLACASCSASDAYRDVRFNKSIDKTTGFTTKSVLCMPVSLSSKEPPVAVLQAINKTKGPHFTKDDERAMHALCMEVALALKRKSVDAAFLRVLKSDSNSYVFVCPLVCFNIVNTVQTNNKRQLMHHCCRCTAEIVQLLDCIQQ